VREATGLLERLFDGPARFFQRPHPTSHYVRDTYPRDPSKMNLAPSPRLSYATN
jgi:hypothetical protein